MSTLGITAVALVSICLVYLAFSTKLLRSYERAFIVRFGRLLDEMKGPGILVIMPMLDHVVRVDLRQETFNVPPTIHLADAERMRVKWSRAKQGFATKQHGG